MQYQVDRRLIHMLASFTAIAIITLLIRNLVVGNSIHNSLFWNLFLGFTPLLIAAVVVRIRSRLNTFWLFVGGAVWLLFYPNAPYIISDFIHVRSDAQPYVVYDTLIIFLFAMLSFYFGLYSIKLAWAVLKDRFSAGTANSIIIFSILLASLGFYLGRVVRLNSWDIFTDPLRVVKEIGNSLFPFVDHWDAYAMMFLFTLAQLLVLQATRGYNEFYQRD